MSYLHANRYRIMVVSAVLGLIAGLTAKQAPSPSGEGPKSSQLVRAHFMEPINDMLAGDYVTVCADISANSHQVQWVGTGGSFSNSKGEDGHVCMDYLAPKVKHRHMVALELASQKHRLDYMKFWVMPEPQFPQ